MPQTNNAYQKAIRLVARFRTGATVFGLLLALIGAALLVSALARGEDIIGWVVLICFGLIVLLGGGLVATFFIRQLESGMGKWPAPAGDTEPRSTNGNGRAAPARDVSTMSDAEMMDMLRRFCRAYGSGDFSGFDIVIMDTLGLQTRMVGELVLDEPVYAHDVVVRVVSTASADVLVHVADFNPRTMVQLLQRPTEASEQTVL